MGPDMTIAFVRDGDALLELMQMGEAKPQKAMRKFINQPENVVNELLEGMALANAKTIKLAKKNLVVRAKAKSRKKVALVTLGGSGHEPALSGYVGKGMLDISVPGEIFAAPGPPRVMEALRKANRKSAGVLFIVLNHAGDVMTGNICMQMVEKEGLNVKQVLTHEDISDKDPAERRGLSGCLLVYKVAGAAAEMGKSLDECVAIAQRMQDNMATLAVAVSAATHPATGGVIADVPNGQMCVGMGQHGEAGGGMQAIKTADETAAIMLPLLLEEKKIAKGDKVLVMINGVGSTTLMEQYVILRSVKKYLDAQGIEMVRCLCGEFLTVQEMGGFQMVVAKMDDELIQLWDAPCETPALTVK
jgi:phosphoenolpyruvate---glycerone phosphotransferase subunit DhaK